MSARIHHALGARARRAATPEALAFVCCNDTLELIPYRQAALVAFDALGRARLVAHSGLVSVEPDAPYALWLGEVAGAIRSQLESLPESVPLAVSPSILDETLASAWSDWMPAHVWALPLRGPDRRVRAVLFFARDEAWPEEIEPGSPAWWLLATAEVYGHAWWALSARGMRLTERLRHFGRTKWVRRGVPVLLLLLLVPVRDYALAPAEVVSLDSEVIASPQDGVIRRISVSPNALVRAGDVIAELDDVTLHNRVAVAQAAFETARAEFLQSSLRAFERQEARAEMGQAEARVRERSAELASLSEELARLQIRAPADGVFVYSDPNDWAGKPVQTGERIGLLSDPGRLGLQAWVPVGDAINLKPGAPMTLFLRVAPLSPIAATLDYAGYQVSESPEGVAGYRVRGTLAENSPVTRVGLRGTVRISGEWTVLGYLVLRRPLATFREWCGC
ncbi:MAG: HlyD family efflux transporter periplasmic adaptor subunit [Luteimonas sp.]|nr:HlyD family efflux transporter periplasmic adaptor subunit [Luteimonas sp.]